MLQANAMSGNTSIQDHDLHLRIQAEFAEMPGLRLTLPQASRLFNLERTVCERVLGTLVDKRLLSQSGAMFVRPGSG
jgi:hypothetical protein